MNMCQNSKDPNGCMFLLVHDIVDECDHDLGEDFEDLLRFEVLCISCNNHRKSFASEFIVFVSVISLSEVDRQPMSESFIVGGPCDRFFVESFNRYIVKHSFCLSNGAGSR